jgi:hypothetical protein
VSAIVQPLLLFLAGALLCNALPHLAAGVRGEPFPTPFATPPGKGDSSPVVNVLWGSFNLAAGLALLLTRLPAAGSTSGLIAIAAGWLVAGVFAAQRNSRPGFPERLLS